MGSGCTWANKTDANVDGRVRGDPATACGKTPVMMAVVMCAHEHMVEAGVCAQHLSAAASDLEENKGSICCIVCDDMGVETRASFRWVEVDTTDGQV